MIDWFDLFAVQGTLKSLLQHHNSSASISGAQPSLWSNSQIHKRPHSVMSDSLPMLWTVARQAPLSMEFSRQEHWSG